MLGKPRVLILLLVGVAVIGGGAITFIETLGLDPGLWGAYAFLILLGEGLLYLAWKVVERDGAGKKLFTLALIGLVSPDRGWCCPVSGLASLGLRRESAAVQVMFIGMRTSGIRMRMHGRGATCP